MPSQALGKYEGAMMKDVDRIIKTHEGLLTGDKGKKALGHLTRAGVLLLCAAWELYVEEVLTDAVKACRDKANSPDDLPLDVQKSIAKYIKASNHQLKALQLAGDGWKTVYLDMVNESVAALNTPKHHNIDKLFHDLVGIPKLSDSWTLGTVPVDSFVTARGAVAHRGADSGYIKVKKLSETYKPQIDQTAIETDNAISTFIRNAFEPKSYPWNRRNL